ncbi:MAG: di-heme oxidoredictase family protein [Pseudomonadota bacterium]|nr:di-heme oxidoredictase family protein [Pseudomonadota bacterium]
MFLLVTQQTLRLVVISKQELHHKKPALCRLFAFSWRVFLLLSSVLLASCGDSDTLAEQRLAGGLATFGTSHLVRFDMPVTSLSAQQKSDFYAGRALAHQPWVTAPASTSARDGLGPLFNARSCLGCHIEGGRGTLPTDDSEPVFTAFVRLSIPGESIESGSVPEPTYGHQVQTQATGLKSQLGLPTGPGDLRAEADLRVIWEETPFKYPDNTVVTLGRPRIDLRDIAYGPMHPETLFSLRQAPAMFGVGLIEAIRQSDIDRLADPEDLNQDGISGRVNQVWSVSDGAVSYGRFGWKANRPDIETTVAAAFADDIGISNTLFPVQPCTEAQPLCLKQPTGNNQDGVELPDDLLTLTVEFLRHTGVPAARLSKDHEAGEQLFHSIGCQQCHQPSFVTSDDASAVHLAGQKIWPYSDLLLHDMGNGLADNRPDYAASGHEWRTAPLWGIGLQKNTGKTLSLLHDGRARSVEEAIIWHGGEALRSRNAFVELDKQDRQQLINFVEAL